MFVGEVGVSVVFVVIEVGVVWVELVVEGVDECVGLFVDVVVVWF